MNFVSLPSSSVKAFWLSFLRLLHCVICDWLPEESPLKQDVRLFSLATQTHTMVSSRVSDSPAPKAHNGNVSSSASVQVTRSLVTDPEAAGSASKYHMYRNSDDPSLHSFLANSRVYSNVGRSHVRSSSYYICSEVRSSRETLVAARGQTEPTMVCV